MKNSNQKYAFLSYYYKCQLFSGVRDAPSFTLFNCGTQQGSLYRNFYPRVVGSLENRCLKFYSASYSKRSPDIFPHFFESINLTNSQHCPSRAKVHFDLWGYTDENLWSYLIVLVKVSNVILIEWDSIWNPPSRLISWSLKYLRFFHLIFIETHWWRLLPRIGVVIVRKPLPFSLSLSPVFIVTVYRCWNFVKRWKKNYEKECFCLLVNFIYRLFTDHSSRMSSER